MLPVLPVHPTSMLLPFPFILHFAALFFCERPGDPSRCVTITRRVHITPGVCRVVAYFFCETSERSFVVRYNHPESTYLLGRQRRPMDVLCFSLVNARGRYPSRCVTITRRVYLTPSVCRVVAYFFVKRPRDPSWCVTITRRVHIYSGVKGGLWTSFVFLL